ncbi:Metallo-dependent phosphatase [Phellopilus nigrolimitatus]|nr:Metallo-dependent phosphatase [Phellopilus nigrolimitatus]
MLSRLLPAALLLIAIIFAFRISTFGSSASHQVPLQQGTPEEPGTGSFIIDDARSYERHIVAVGDLHSDYGNALKVLQMAKVVDAAGDWTGDIDLFVQTGDIIDRGTDTIKLYLWMEKLRSQARAVGGDVVSHLGNHEWMNLLADWRYVYPNEISTFGSVAARQKMLQTGRIGRAWAANYSITSRIPLYPPMGLDSPFPTAPFYASPSVDFDPASLSANAPLSHAALSFVHGGLSPSYAHLTPYPERINALGRQLLFRLQTRDFPPPHPPASYAGLPDDATPEERSLYDNDGPLWYRGWAMRSENEVCAEVDEVLERIGVRRLIMGHTPDFEHINSRCGGKVIIIDTGISHAYGGALSALSVKYTLAPHRDDKRRWIERELVTALYPDRQEVLVIEEHELTGEL